MCDILRNKSRLISKLLLKLLNMAQYKTLKEIHRFLIKNNLLHQENLPRHTVENFLQESNNKKSRHFNKKPEIMRVTHKFSGF